MTNNGEEANPKNQDGAAVVSEQPKKEPSGPIAELVDELEDAPPQVKRMIEMMSISTSKRGGYHPIFDKFNEEHVSTFLNNLHDDDQNQYRYHRSNRWFRLAYVVVGVAVFVFLVVFLSADNKDLLADILKLTVAFLGGVGSGYGIKVHMAKSHRS